MDHSLKILLINNIQFLDIIEYFQMKNLEIDIENVDDDD